MTGHHIVERRRVALVGNVLHVDAGEMFEQLTAQVRALLVRMSELEDSDS